MGVSLVGIQGLAMHEIVEKPEAIEAEMVMLAGTTIESNKRSGEFNGWPIVLPLHEWGAQSLWGWIGL
ncbi:MAG: hypothetical protein GY938_14075 [Ketobacter sp.]|nr:hypothetical protein [Ketobacter sp.]